DVLKEILARPAYAGMVEIADGLRAGEQPAIVSLELFRRCEDIRRRHRPGLGGPVRARRHRESPFALIPLLRCADCGAPMRGVAESIGQSRIATTSAPTAAAMAPAARHSPTSTPSRLN